MNNPQHYAVPIYSDPAEALRDHLARLRDALPTLGRHEVLIAGDLLLPSEWLNPAHIGAVEHYLGSGVKVTFDHSRSEFRITKKG